MKMREIFRGKMLLAGACMMIGLCTWGPSHSFAQDVSPVVEMTVNFDAARANTVPAYNFWMQGGSVQVCGRVTHHWGAATDISYLHTAQMPGTQIGLDLVTAVFGPRYTITLPSGRFRVYGQALGGVTHGMNSVFPNSQGSSVSTTGAALLLGGGWDYGISHRVSVRILDAAWLRTALSNGTTTVQNNLRLGSGIVFRF